MRKGLTIFASLLLIVFAGGCASSPRLEEVVFIPNANRKLKGEKSPYRVVRVPAAYGYPTPEALEDHAAGKLVLMGCVIEGPGVEFVLVCREKRMVFFEFSDGTIIRQGRTYKGVTPGIANYDDFEAAFFPEYSEEEKASRVKAEKDFLDAVRSGNIDRVKELMSTCVDISIRAEYGYTAFHLAVMHDRLDIARLLLDHGLSVNSRNGARRNPLHDAVSKEMVQFLIQEGVDINAQDFWGYTPLHLFAESGNEEIAQILIEHGADISIRSEKGETPLDFAKTDEMKKLLRFQNTNAGKGLQEKDK